MSIRLPFIKEKLAGIKSTLAATKNGEAYPAGLQTRLGRVSNIVIENESKIWLRTKVGEPMLRELQDAVDNAHKLLEGECAQEFEAALRMVEVKAAKIDEESRRRSMVVT
jgi:hypothetical protein